MHTAQGHQGSEQQALLENHYFDTEADVGGGSDSISGANGWLKVGMENPQ